MFESSHPDHFMPPYRDPSHDSGIGAYELGEGWIAVAFKDGGCYLYDRTRPGARHVAAMTRLAVRGEGLNTYINEHVRDNYAEKLR